MKKIYVVLLTITLIISLINLPSVKANVPNSGPTDWTNTLPFQLISGIEIFNSENGNETNLIFSNLPFPTQMVTDDLIKKDAQLSVRFYLDFSQNQNGASDIGYFKENDTYRIKLPDQFLSAVGLSNSLMIVNHEDYGGNQDDTHVEAIHAKVITGNYLELKFNKPIEFENLLTDGRIRITLGLDKSKIGNQNPTKILFEIPGQTSTSFEVDLDFEVETPTMEKIAVDYDRQNKEIEWQITVNKQMAIVNNAVVTDNLPAGLTYVDNSLTITSPINEATETYTDPTKKGLVLSSLSNSFTYYFPDVINNEYKLNFKTKVDNSWLTNPAFNGQGNISFTNNASFTYKDLVTPLTAQATRETEAVKLFIKTGTYDRSTRSITWTFSINEIGGTLFNTKFEDILPTHLTYINGSATFDLGNTNNPTSITPVTSTEAGKQKLTIDLGEVDRIGTLTFRTAIADAFYRQDNVTNSKVDNEALLSWATVNNGTLDKSTTSRVEVGTPNIAPITKSFKTYNASTGRISWEVEVNSNHIDLTNIKVKDIIEPNHTVIPNTVTLTVVSKSNVKKVDGVSLFNAAGNPNTIAELPDSIFDYKEKNGSIKEYWEYKEVANPSNIVTSDKYIFNFQTQINSTEVYQNNDTSSAFRNEVSLYEVLTSGDIPITDTTATYTVNSNIVTKTNEGYNYTTNRFKWKVVVNKNKNILTDVQFTDIISGGMAYFTDSFKVDGNLVADSIVVGSTTVNGTTYTQLNYNYANLNDQSIIEFETYLPTAHINEKFIENGNFTYTNTASIKHPNIQSAATSTASATVKNVIVGKQGARVGNNDYIDWEVHINSNSVDYHSFIDVEGDLVIRDVLPSNLKLDVDSVQLYKETIDADGKYIYTGALVPNVYSKEHIKYNTTTNTFEFVLPKPLSGGYRLEFTTFIVAGGTINNEVSFAGSLLSHDATSNQMVVNWATIDGTLSAARGTIEVEKVDVRDANQLLAGAEFVLLNSSGIELDRLVTDATGKGEFKNLRLGTRYRVMEVKAPEGYLLKSEAELRKGNSTVPDKTLDISDEYTIPNNATKSVTYTATNEINRGSITFTKHGYEDVELEGAEFKLYNAQNESIDTVTSDANGIVTFTNVAKGTYTIRETKAPTGYRLSNDVLTATIVDEKSVVNPTSGTKVTNDIQRGKVTLTKADNENNEKLEGAEFEIYKAADTTFTTALDIQTTDATGTLEFANLPYGSYLIRETTPPVGYLTNETTYTASITSDGQNVPLTVSNQVIKGIIQFTKLGLYDKPQANAEFELYDANSVLVDTKTSDVNGVVKFENIRYGSYTIKETKVPTGYHLSTQILAATVIENGKMVATSPNKIVNEPYRSDVRLIKISSDNRLLSGGVFEIYDADDTEFLTSRGSATSDVNGVVLFEDIPYGHYVVKEVRAPSGYSINRDLLSVSIIADGQTYNLGSFINQPAPIGKFEGSIVVKKLNESNNTLPGAVFGLYTTTDKLVATSTSNSAGIAFFDEVKFGNYVIKEITAPTGYILNTQKYDVDVFNVEKAVNIEVINEKITGTVLVNKVNNKNESLPNALIALYDEQGNEVARGLSDEAGVVALTNIPYGNYLLQELRAPDGYQLDATTKAVSIVTKGQISTVQFINHELKLLGDLNTKEQVPSTTKVERQISTATTGIVKNNEKENSLPKVGDSIMTKVLIFVVSFISLLTIVLLVRRKKHKQV